ncbi:MAG TPA: Gfo/Idh/MocA family oxidoreductase [Minicystis sp.]|nr:Gfo/Idh/MocA family oxidoreductase [Minicystis sp.]
MPLRFGVLGPGSIADHFLAPAIARVRGAELWSVCSRDAGRARAFAARHGAKSPSPAFDDEAAFLADPKLDVVLVATPDRLHASQAIAAARAGKHVLVEKPMATSAAEARAMVEACGAANVKLGVAYHLRHHGGHEVLARAVHEGALGEVRHARVLWAYKARDASNWRAREDVGRWWALAGVGTHCVDLARWLLVPRAGEVTEVRAVTSRSVFGGPHEETAVAALRFASGATAEIVASVLFDATSAVDVFGDAASASAEGTLGPHGRGRLRIRGAEVGFPHQDPYAREIADFVAAVEQDRAPEVDGHEGLRNVEILEQIA